MHGGKADGTLVKRGGKGGSAGAVAAGRDSSRSSSEHTGCKEEQGLGLLVWLSAAAEDSRAGGRDTEGMPDGDPPALSPGTATGQGTGLFPTGQRSKATGTASNAKLPSQLLVCGLFLRGAAHTDKGLCSP